MLARARFGIPLLAAAVCFSSARAEEPPSQDDRIRALEDTVAKQAKTIADLQKRNDPNERWLDDKRADEVRTLIQEVLADADTRASLLQDGAVAGYTDRGFFVGSPDGKFLMNLGALFQVQYIYNRRDNGDTDLDRNVSGFRLSRAELYVGGVAHDFMYNLRLAHDHDEGEGEAYVKEAFVSRNLTDSIVIGVGGFHDNFSREEQIADANQQAVERSFVNEIFTNDYVVGAFLAYRPPNGPLDASLAIHNGARSFSPDNSDDFDNSSDFAGTARVDFRVLGQRDARADMQSWSGEGNRLGIGGGASWDIKETGGTNRNDKAIKWTLDTAFEGGGFGAYFGVFSANIDRDDTAPNAQPFGFVTQLAYMICPDKFDVFGRYEYADLEHGANATLSDDKVSILTFGCNYYLQHHHAKITADFLYSFVAIPPAADLGFFSEDTTKQYGLLPDAAGEDGQWAARLQFQLGF